MPYIYIPGTRELPPVVPVLPLPLDQYLLLPRTQIPFNLTELWQHQLVEDVRAENGYLGLLQSFDGKGEPGPGEPPLRLYPVGCLARVLEVRRTGAASFAAILYGIIRFRVREELPPDEMGRRRVAPEYQGFVKDLAEEPDDVDLSEFQRVVRREVEALSPGVDVSHLESMRGRDLIKGMAQVLQLTTAERQSLLEAPSFDELMQSLVLLMAAAASTTAGVDLSRFPKPS
jgi:uncharacterized protein